MATQPIASSDYLEQIRQRRLHRPGASAAVPGADFVVPKTSSTAPNGAATISSDPQPSSSLLSQPTTQLNNQATTQTQAQAASQPRPQAQTAIQPQSQSQPNTSIPPDAMADDDLLWQKPQPEEVLLEWRAPSRPFKKRNRQFYLTISAIVGLICLILFFAGQFLPIAVVIALAFLGYVLASVKPDEVTNQITSYGIRNDQTLYYWEEMGRFWFTEKFKQPVLNIEVPRFPYRVAILIDDLPKDELQDVLSYVLLLEQPPLTWLDKAAERLQQLIPLDSDDGATSSVPQSLSK